MVTQTNNADALFEACTLLRNGGAKADVLAAFLNIAAQRDQLTTERDQLTTERDQLTTERDQQRAIIEEKDQRIRWLERMLFGRKSEKLTAEQLGQLVLAYDGVPEGEATTIPVPECVDVTPEEAAPSSSKRVTQHRGRIKLSEDLERIVHEVVVPESERACTGCGADMPVFGHVEHERVEYVPAKIVVHVERREKRACKACRQDALTADRTTTAESPCRAGASLLAHLIESKCDDALPIYRQCDQLARLGFSLPDSTAYGYWTYAMRMLLPVTDALFSSLFNKPAWVGVDDTSLTVLDRTKNSGKYRGHLWCFLSSDGLVAYRFTNTWSATEVAPWFELVGDDTHIQVDDYKGYNARVLDSNKRVRTVVDPNRRLGCMMHVRRRFFAALEAGDKRATKPVALIRDIYKVEAKARGLGPDERLSLRQAHSMRLLDDFDHWVDTNKNVILSGKLSEAIRYAEQQRPYVRRCFSNGRFEIDNGAAERAIRDPAIGRKNFLFTGSEEAAIRLAGAYSLVQTCRSLGVSTHRYLVDVLTKLEARWPLRRLTELLPQNWKP